jgi:hypothetical protein
MITGQAEHPLKEYLIAFKHSLLFLTIILLVIAADFVLYGIRGASVLKLAAISIANKYSILLIFSGFVLVNITVNWIVDPDTIVSRNADDAFYYYKIAENITKLGFITFDGIHVTNGFHPLWLINLIPFFLLDLEKLTTLRFVSTYSLILYGIAGWIAWRYLFKHFSFTSALVSFSMFLYLTRDIPFLNMEISLLLPIAIITLVYCEENNLFRDLQSGAVRSFLLVGCFLALAQLSRLDAVFLCGSVILVIFVWNIHNINHTSAFKKMVALIAPVLLSGVLVIYANISMIGHFVPISGLVKSMGDSWINKLFLNQLVSETYWIEYLMVVLVCLAWFGVKIKKLCLHNQASFGQGSALSTVLFVLIYTLYNLSSSWRLWQWYSYPLAMVAVFVFPILIQDLQLLNILRRNKVVVSMLLLGLCTTVVTKSTLYRASLGDPEKKFEVMNREVANILNGQFVKKPVVAMGDRAGSFGYFYEGKTLQLEGLVGGVDTLEAIKEDRLEEFLTKNDVGLVVDYGYTTGNKEKYILTTPKPGLSMGPFAHITLCRESLLLSREGQFIEQNESVYVWIWPSCGERGG